MHFLLDFRILFRFVWTKQIWFQWSIFHYHTNNFDFELQKNKIKPKFNKYCVPTDKTTHETEVFCAQLFFWLKITRTVAIVKLEVKQIEPDTAGIVVVNPNGMAWTTPWKVPPPENVTTKIIFTIQKKSYDNLNILIKWVIN